MKIAIHGTKGGYHIFTPERIPGLIDARPDYNKVATIGRQAYAINFNGDHVIFSKYRIVRDVVGQKRTGHVAFSVIIPNNKKLPGADVQALLDRLSDEYSKYIIEDNLDNVREDWGFLQELSSQYDARLQPVLAKNEEFIRPGSQEAAYVYYPTIEKLQSYFDAPYQEEYEAYKQVFFVDGQFEGKPDNPLNALRYGSESNLTTRIDLLNLKYKLLFNDNPLSGVNVEVKVDGNRKTNRSQIRRKDTIQISYSKRYFEPVTKAGRWNELEPEIVAVDDDAKTVTVKVIELSPRTKTIFFEAKDEQSKYIDNFNLTVVNNNTKFLLPAIDNKVSFSGEELKDRWTAIAKQGNLSGQQDFTPELLEGSVVLTLKEQKRIKIIAIDDSNGDRIKGIRIQISTKKQPDDDEVCFIGDEIRRNWKIKVFERYEIYHPRTIDLVPATVEDNLFGVKLTKRDDIQQPTTGEKHNKLSSGDRSISKGDTRFINHQKGDVFYEKSAFLAGVVVLFFAAVILTGYFLTRPSELPPPIVNPALIDSKANRDCKKVIDYCNGTELNPAKLIAYKNNDCKGTNCCSNLENAISIRTSIGQGKIAELKKMQYSPVQDLFKTAVFSVDDNLQGKIGKVVSGNLFSDKDLDFLANFIINLQKLWKLDVSSLQTEDECITKLEEIELWALPAIKVVDDVKQKIQRRKEYLSKESPEETDDQPVAKSIKPEVREPDNAKPRPAVHKTSVLHNNFWALVQSGNTAKDSYDNLLKQYKKNSNLAGEEKEIINYLKKICSSSRSFDQFKNIDAKIRIKAGTLTEIDINRQ